MLWRNKNCQLVSPLHIRWAFKPRTWEHLEEIIELQLPPLLLSPLLSQSPHQVDCENLFKISSAHFTLISSLYFNIPPHETQNGLKDPARPRIWDRILIFLSWSKTVMRTVLWLHQVLPARPCVVSPLTTAQLGLVWLWDSGQDQHSNLCGWNCQYCRL